MYGWICPKCGKVYGPNVAECYPCNGSKFSYTLSSTNIAKTDYDKWKETNAYYGKHSEERGEAKSDN